MYRFRLESFDLPIFLPARFRYLFCQRRTTVRPAVRTYIPLFFVNSSAVAGLLAFSGL